MIIASTAVTAIAPPLSQPRQQAPSTPMPPPPPDREGTTPLVPPQPNAFVESRPAPEAIDDPVRALLTGATYGLRDSGPGTTAFPSVAPAEGAALSVAQHRARETYTMASDFVS